MRRLIFQANSHFEITVILSSLLILHDFYVEDFDIFFGLFFVCPSILDFVNDV